MWIHEHKQWSNFTWDINALISQLTEVRHRQGRLLGQMGMLDFELRNEASLGTLTTDVIKSSAIEGVYLNPDEVRSAIARRLGIEIGESIPTSHNVEGIVELMLDATQQFSKPLTKERLFAWHVALFPTGFSGLYRITVGDWRATDEDPMQVVSGPIGREKVHFEAPNAARLECEMSAFLKWFEGQTKQTKQTRQTDIDPVFKAGIAHLWFATIHPFADGNGRIARAVCDMALACADNMPQRFYSLSGQIESERKDYYDQLERQQRGTPDITGWLEWFLGCLGRTVTSAESTLDKILLKARLWDKINQSLSVNERQRHIINRMLEDDFEGYINTSKYAKLAKCSRDTALRDIQELKKHDVLIQNPGSGRSTSYRLPTQEEV